MVCLISRIRAELTLVVHTPALDVARAHERTGKVQASADGLHFFEDVVRRRRAQEGRRRVPAEAAAKIGSPTPDATGPCQSAGMIVAGRDSLHAADHVARRNGPAPGCRSVAELAEGAFSPAADAARSRESAGVVATGGDSPDAAKHVDRKSVV